MGSSRKIVETGYERSHPMLRIGFDAKRLFNNSTGLGNYSRTLVKGLKEHCPGHEYVLFSPRVRQTGETGYFLSGTFECRTAGRLPGWFWRTIAMRRDIEDAGLDIYHGLSNELPLGIGGWAVRGIVTIHDLIFRLYPEDYPAIDRIAYEMKFRHACETSRRIIAVSQSTKNDIMAHYGIQENKIAVVYQPCDDRFLRDVGERETASTLSRYGLPRRYLLYVGTINRRKNLLSLVIAMRLVKKTINMPLVVVGSGKEYKKRIERYVGDNGLGDRVIFAPPVAADDLPALYRTSSMVVLPSKYEGFGLPIIEALYCRVPVITTKLSSLPEAAGPGAFYADPDKPESIAEGIVALATKPDYAAQLADEGYRHVLRFNAKAASERLLAIYLEEMNAVNGKGKRTG